MFTHLHAYIERVVSFLLTINDGVKWHEVLNKIVGMESERQLSRLRSYLWTDKDIDQEDQSIEHEYTRYTKMLFDNLEKLNDANTVVILGPPEDKSEQVENPSEALNNITIVRANILSNILTLKMVPHRVAHTLTGMSRSELIFPTCGLMYKDADFSKFNIIHDDMCNLYTTDIEREECLFKLCVLAMLIDPETKAADCMKLTFGIHKI